MNKKVDNYLYFVDRILSVKQKDPDADTLALERQIDQMVYKLYHLTPEEIVIVEGRSNNGNKTRQAADKQQKAIEVLLGKTLLRVFDFEEDREG